MGDSYSINHWGVSPLPGDEVNPQNFYLLIKLVNPAIELEVKLPYLIHLNPLHSFLISPSPSPLSNIEFDLIQSIYTLNVCASC